MRCTTSAVAAIGFAISTASAQTPSKTLIGNLGRCRLELGGVIEQCRLGYRTFGTLAPDRRNAILIPTWFASPAESWLPLLGPKGVVDTAGFYVVVVESLGAGKSSSPSNSTTQRGAAFPEITIGDMVEASYRLAQEQLNLPELYAVVGISLGGMQAFEWGVSHPDYVRRVVPIVGAPRMGIYGRAMWELLTRAIEEGVRGVVPRDSTRRMLARFFIVANTSPQAENTRSSDTYGQYLGSLVDWVRDVDLNEWACHARAILRHDVARRFEGNMAQAARVWKARTLVVSATYDHSVDAAPALEFARLIRADTLVMASPAGHSAIFSDTSAHVAVRAFLAR